MILKTTSNIYAIFKELKSELNAGSSSFKLSCEGCLLQTPVAFSPDGN